LLFPQHTGGPLNPFGKIHVLYEPQWTLATPPVSSDSLEADVETTALLFSPKQTSCSLLSSTHMWFQPPDMLTACSPETEPLKVWLLVPGRLDRSMQVGSPVTCAAASPPLDRPQQKSLEAQAVFSTIAHEP